VRWALVATGIAMVAFGVAAVVDPPAPDDRSAHGGGYEGWMVDVPPGWDVQVLDGERCEYLGYRSTAILTDADFVFRGPRPGDPEECLGRFILAGFPRGRVALAFQPSGTQIGLFVPECLEAPIALDDLTKVRRQGQGPVKVRFGSVCADPGRREARPAYDVTTWVGRDAPPSAVAELERALASFRFLRPPGDG
jgi:hypothetical protein